MTGNISEIGIDAFRECTSLTEIVIPDTVVKVGSLAFYGCTELKDITIGKKVSRLDNYCFSECTGLQKIRYSRTIAGWNTIEKDSNWDKNTGNYTIVCSDGTIAKS